jgi:alpha/beta superfamily hydrolase
MSRSASRHVSFEGAFGDALAARIDLPEGEPRAWALFAHCFTCGKDLKSVGRIGRALAARGIAVLRFDFTGIGESGGEFAETTFSSNVEDLLAAAGFMRASFAAPSLLVGHSLGGAAELLDDLAAHSLGEILDRLDRPLLVLHSPADTTVDVAHGEELFARARQPKSFVCLDGADHLLLARPADAVFVGELIATWAGRYLP